MTFSAASACIVAVTSVTAVMAVASATSPPPARWITRTERPHSTLLTVRMIIGQRVAHLQLVDDRQRRADTQREPGEQDDAGEQHRVALLDQRQDAEPDEHHGQRERHARDDERADPVAGVLGIGHRLADRHRLQAEAGEEPHERNDVRIVIHWP